MADAQAMLKRFLNDTALGRRLRHSWEPTVRDVLGVRPIRFRQPRSLNESVSDAFVWRRDHDFETRFELMNLRSFIDPDNASREHALMMFFSKSGKEIGRSSFKLDPFEIRRVDLADTLPIGTTGYGTFCVFHEQEAASDSHDLGTCLMDRSYASYTNSQNRSLWSYVHGCCNTYVLSYSFSRSKTCHLSIDTRRKQVYKPQLQFDDCQRFEVCVSNPLSKPTTISVNVADADGTEVERVVADLDPLACRMISIDNAKFDKARIEIEGNVQLCRPLLFKYYDSHFDVLHA